MTLSAIRSDVQANLPANYHSADLTNAKIDEFINKVQRRICRMWNFEFMKQEVTRSTVDNTQKYAIPSAGDATWSEIESEIVRLFKRSHDCFLINNVNNRVALDKRFKKSIQDDPRFRDETEKGTPSAWAQEQEFIWLFNIPDHQANQNTAWTIHLIFYGYLADLSADGDTNWLVANQPELLEFLATAECYHFGLDFDTRDEYKRKGAELFQELKDEDNDRKISSIEEGLTPQSGQSIGNHRWGTRKSELRAHYES